MLPYIKQLLNSFDGGALAQIQEDLDPLEDLYQLVDAAIVDDPPYLMRDGGMIKDGYNEMSIITVTPRPRANSAE